MKVILSRKGFDSVSGGMMSPIMPNGELVSMPIPCGGDPTSYRDVMYAGRTLRDVLLELNPRFNFGDCHLDPDIEKSRHTVVPGGWKAAFGQSSASASFLNNTVKVESGDLFLFFGNFHATERHDGRLRFVHRSGDFYRDSDLHVIWGYLQVGEVIRDQKRIVSEFPWHPHAHLGRPKDSRNTIFVASKKLSFADSLPGSGLLPYDCKRVLTLEGERRSVWRKACAYALDNIIGSRKNLAPPESEGVRFGGQWQELALKSTKASFDFAKRMILP